MKILGLAETFIAKGRPNLKGCTQVSGFVPLLRCKAEGVQHSVGSWLRTIGFGFPLFHMQPKPLEELVSEPIVIATADARVGPDPFIAMGPSHVRPAAIVNVPELVLLPPRTRTQVDSEPFRGYRPIENPWELGTTYMPEPVSQVHQSPSGLTLSDLLNGHDEPIQVDN